METLQFTIEINTPASKGPAGHRGRQAAGSTSAWCWSCGPAAARVSPPGAAPGS